MGKGIRVYEVVAYLCNPCPVCRKSPKIYRDFGYEDAGFGAWCTVECKPFLRKPHLKIDCGKATWKMALVGAVEAWDRRAEDGKTENC